MSQHARLLQRLVCSYVWEADPAYRVLIITMLAYPDMPMSAAKRMAGLSVKSEFFEDDLKKDIEAVNQDLADEMRKILAASRMRKIRSEKSPVVQHFREAEIEMPRPKVQAAKKKKGANLSGTRQVMLADEIAPTEIIAAAKQRESDELGVNQEMDDPPFDDDDPEDGSSSVPVKKRDLPEDLAGAPEEFYHWWAGNLPNGDVRERAILDPLKFAKSFDKHWNENYRDCRTRFIALTKQTS